jgi:esterase
VKLFCRKYGSGPPLIILHGLYGSSDNWVSIAKNLSGKFTVYLPDQRNHGQSPHSAEMDYSLMSKDLYELATEQNLRKFFLTGHSMGGKVAAEFAVNWPSFIEYLTVIDISPFSTEYKEKDFYQEHKEILEAILSTDLKNFVSRYDIEEHLSIKIKSERTLGFIMKNIQRTGEHTFTWKINVDSINNNLEKIIDGIPYVKNEFLPVTGFPVLIVKGEKSEYLAEQDMVKIKRLFPVADMTVVKNAGHWIHADRPEAITEILLSQLTT